MSVAHLMSLFEQLSSETGSMSTDREKSLAEYDRAMVRQSHTLYRKCVIVGCGHVFLFMRAREICPCCEEKELEQS